MLLAVHEPEEPVPMQGPESGNLQYFFKFRYSTLTMTLLSTAGLSMRRDTVTATSSHMGTGGTTRRAYNYELE